MVSANPGGLSQVYAYVTDRRITHAAAEITFRIYLNLTYSDILRRAFQLRITPRTAAQ